MAKKVKSGARNGSKVSKKPVAEKKNLKKVSADDLKWKDVKIAKSVDVVEGFFGLEEIEGVDVVYQNGQAQLVTADSSKIKSEKEKNGPAKEKKNYSLLTEEEEKELDEKFNGNDNDQHDEEEEEFTGFSDGEESGDNEKVLEDGDFLTLENLKSLDLGAETKETDSDSSSVDSDLLEDYKQNLEKARVSDVLDSDESIEISEEVSKSWSDLSLSRYSLGALSALKFSSPTPIQKMCIPYATAKHDVIGKASTGSGKTLAYGLPLLERFLLRVKENGNRAVENPVGIVFTPTRELAKQVHSHFINIVEQYPVKDAQMVKNMIVPITGGLSVQKQERLLSYQPGLIIATPGRMLELLELDKDNLLARLSSIEVLVLDEADRLLQEGHFAELEKIVEILAKNRKNTQRWQTLVFLATFSRVLFSKLDKNVKKGQKKTKAKKKSRKKNPVDNTETLTTDSEIVEYLKSCLRFKDKNPKIVNINPKEVVSGTISEALIECEGTSRDLYLYYFVTMYPGTSLVFTNSIDSVKRLVAFLRLLKIRSFSIHSSMLQKQRLKNLENFHKFCLEHKGETAVLVATDVAARGLDIPTINHVVHYHLPRSADLYVHRAGRTGRAGNEGVLVMMCSPQEAGGPLRRLRRLLAEEASKNNGGDQSELSAFSSLEDDVKLLPIEVSLLDQLRGRVSLAAELAAADVSKGSLSKEDLWVKKVALALELDDISDFEDEALAKKRLKKEEKTMDQHVYKSKLRDLNLLLEKKLRVGGSRKYLSNGIVNMADIMVHNKGHGNIVGYNKVDVLDVIQKSQRHKDRLEKLKESKEREVEQKRERKRAKRERKDGKKKRKAEKENEGNDYSDED